MKPSHTNIIILTAVACTLPVYLLISFPPFWNFIDSAFILQAPLSKLIPHYPALYPLFTRAIGYLSMCKHEPPSATLISDINIYIIVILQHVLLIASMLFFANTTADTLFKKLIGLMVFIINPSIFLINHGIYTESIWISFILIQLAGAFIIYFRQTTFFRYHVIYYAALYLNILTRHIGIILAMLLPVLFLTSFLFRIIKKRNNIKTDKTVNKLLASAALTILVIISADLSNKLICRAFSNIPYHSMWGRQGSYRINPIEWDIIDLDEKNRVIARLQSKSNDYLVKKAIPIVFNSKDPWIEMYTSIQNITEKEYPDRISYDTDRILNKICLLNLMSPNKYLIKAIIKDIKCYFTENNCRFLFSIFSNHRNFIMIYNNDACYKDFFRNVRCAALDSLPQFDAATKSLSKSLYMKIVEKIHYGYLFIIIAALSLLCFFTKLLDAKRFIFIMSVLLISIIYTVSISIITIHIERYSIFNMVSLTALLALLLTGIDYKRLLALL